jgi:predicted O-methyltransferase YrrM
VGTHIGASTAYIALALKKNGTDRRKLISLDIYDVNNLNTKIYSNLGVTHSPLEMMRKINCDSFVEFITCPSLEYMQKCDSKFDFIFLDGDHSAKTVYREIGHALKLLNKNGTILLHDYFPNLKPLWSNGNVLFGPYMAVHRLIQEGLSINAIPLGLLPWSTKMNSNRTSLALLSKNE